MAEKDFEQLKKLVEEQELESEKLLSTYRNITSELSAQRKELQKQKKEVEDLVDKMRLEDELDKNNLEIKKVVLKNLLEQNDTQENILNKLQNKKKELEEEIKINQNIGASYETQEKNLEKIEEKLNIQIANKEKIEKQNKQAIEDIRFQISETQKQNEEIKRIRDNLTGYAKKGEEFVKNTIGSGGKKYFDRIQDFIKSKDQIFLTSEFFLKGAKNFLTGKNLLAMGLSTMLEQTINVTKELETQSAQTAALTGQQRLFSDEIYESSKNNREYGISLSETANSFRQLFSNVSKFTTLSKESRKELTEFASKMNVFGVSLSTVSKNTEELTMSLRMSVMDAKRTQMEIFSLSKEIGFNINRLQEQFSQSIQQLSVYGERGIQIFKSLAGVQKLTGVSISKLQQLFGSSMDTFEDTARIAGNLNTILGRDLVNSVDLLNASDEQRIRIILSAIEATGKQFNQMTKHEKLALANAAGIKDIAEANKILGMSTLAYDEMQLKTRLAKEDQEDFNKSIRPSIEFMKKLQIGFQEFAVGVQPIVKVGNFLLDKLLNPTFKLIGNIIGFVDTLLTKMTPFERGFYFIGDAVGTLISAFSSLFELNFSDFFAKIVDSVVKATWGLLKFLNPVSYIIKAYDYITGSNYEKWMDDFVLKNKDYAESLKEVRPELEKNTSAFKKDHQVRTNKGSPALWEMDKVMSDNAMQYSTSLKTVTPQIEQLTEKSRNLHQVKTKKGSPALWEMDKVMAEGTREYNQEIKNIQPQIMSVTNNSKEMQSNLQSVTNSFRQNTNNNNTNMIENVVSSVMNMLSGNKKEQRDVKVTVDVNLADIDGTKRSFREAVVTAINEATR